MGRWMGALIFRENFFFQNWLGLTVKTCSTFKFNCNSLNQCILGLLIWGGRPMVEELDLTEAYIRNFMAKFSCKSFGEISSNNNIIAAFS